MATPKSSRRRAREEAPAIEGAAPRDPSVVTDEMLRAAEERIGLMEAGKRSAFWLTIEKVGQSRIDALRNTREGLLRRLGRGPRLDDAGRLHPAPTEAEIASVQRELENHEWLMRLPQFIQDRATEELARMREQRIRQAEA